MKNIISKKIKKSIIRHSYNKYICDTHKESKKFSYKKFQKYIDNGVSEHVTNYHLMNTYKYKFNKKELYMIIAKHHSFADQNIKKIMNTIDQCDIIDKLSCSFFSIKN